jgi:hypothetical protein
MSKMDNLRAMREAKYDANAKRTSGKATAPAKPAPVAPAAPRAKGSAAAPSADSAAPAEALCGHRNMSGRTCTREAGHAAKSHRYS